MRPLNSCTPDMLSHRCRPSLLLSIFSLAYSSSIPKKSMREVSDAPLLLQTSSRARQNWNNLWCSMVSSLSCPLRLRSTCTYTYPHRSTCTRAWTQTLLPPQKPPAPTEQQDGSWLRKSSLPPSISLSSTNIWSKTDLCSYLNDSRVRSVWFTYRNSNVQRAWGKGYWILACTALPETQVARGWRRDQNGRKMWDVLRSLSFSSIGEKWSVIFLCKQQGKKLKENPIILGGCNMCHGYISLR